MQQARDQETGRSVVESELSDYLAGIRLRVDNYLAGLASNTSPENLYEPVRYVLQGKGKRLRASLVALAAELFGGSEAAVLPVAVSVEVFHAFTLVHDDIMDRSGVRRGQPTVHVKWNDATAILVGDYLLGICFQLLEEAPEHARPRLLHLLNRTVVQLCEGQMRDMGFERRVDVTLEEYLRMIDQKTGTLLQTSLQMGAVTGSASVSDLDRLASLGYELGRAFQIQDDLLDLTASDSRWGKPIGGDLRCGKKTWLVLYALESASPADREWVRTTLLGDGIPENRIPEAKERLMQMQVLDQARNTVSGHFERARGLLLQMPGGRPVALLNRLIEDLEKRVH